MRKIITVALTAILLISCLGILPSMAEETPGGDSVVMLSASENSSAIVLPQIFDDNMVIQRDRPIVVSGTCSNGSSQITATLGSQSQTSPITDGAWSVTFDAQPANKEGQDLVIVAGEDKYTVQNILIGDVWLCSGQSNMQWKVSQISGKKYKGMYEAIQDNTMVRYFLVPVAYSNEPQTTFKEGENVYWSIPSKSEMQNYGAYDFSFGACLQESLDIPIGIINASCGGTQIVHWLSAAGQSYAGTVFGDSFFNAMVNPLEGIEVKGMLWYQGESNINLPSDYTVYFKALARSLREFFNNPDMPIITTQLPRYEADEYPKWPQFRLEQWDIAAAMENVEIVCGIDLGSPTFELHPSDKFEFGVRAAELTLNTVYGMEDKPGRSAYPCGLTVSENGWKLGFKNAESGLVWKGDRIRELYLIKKDGTSVKAKGSVVDGTYFEITNVSDDVVRIQYCIAPVPDGTFYTENGLPVAPFDLRINRVPELVITGVSAAGATDGKIGGLDIGFEYRAANETEFTRLKGDEITGLAAGTYIIREVASNGYISLEATVEVPDYQEGQSGESPAPSDSESSSGQKSGGCKSTVFAGASLIALSALLGGAWMTHKKKH